MSLINISDLKNLDLIISQTQDDMSMTIISDPKHLA